MQGSGVSSESIWTTFDSTTTATVRKVVGLCWIAWTRLANVSNYATIGSSVINGTDIVQGLGATPVNNADSFSYFDESDKILRIEYERSLIEPLGGMSIGLCDILLDNTDLRFTPDNNSTIGTALRPNRPLKIFIGFNIQGQDKVIPIIEGLTLQPKEDKVKRTVTITAYDFLQWLNTKPQETAVYTNQRSDQIIADILGRAGIGSSNYALDQGLNTVGFAWFEKGDTAGERIRKLVEAEEGVFYQDENGVFRFENRDKYARAPYNSAIWTLTGDDILDWKQDYSNQIINRAIIKGKPRSVKGETEIWRNGMEEQIPAGSTVTIWANFEDPVSDITTPAASTDFTAYSNTGGTGTNVTASISIVMTEYTKAAKLEITNASGGTAYLNFMRLRGTPATIDYEVEEVFEDSNSIADYNESQKIIDNEFIDDRNFARNMAQNIVRRNKVPTNRLILTVRGIPQLQLRDQVRVQDPDLSTYKNYRLTKIQGTLEGGDFTQKLYLREITDNESL